MKTTAPHLPSAPAPALPTTLAPMRPRAARARGLGGRCAGLVSALALAAPLHAAVPGSTASSTAANAPAACSAHSAEKAPQVVELYTSEGCSSCPPADRWLSTLKGRADVLALNFHVTYWDRLGWPDRFADAAYTERQYLWAQRHRSAQVYTPQVIADGQDWRGWRGSPALPGPARNPAPVRLQMLRDGDVVKVEVSAAAAGTPTLSGYWAVLEDGHATRVRAGENRGETLQHDHVVRLLREVPAWAATAGLRSQLAVTRGDPATPRRVAFVVTDGATGRPLQALSLGC